MTFDVLNNETGEIHSTGRPRHKRKRNVWKILFYVMLTLFILFVMGSQERYSAALFPCAQEDSTNCYWDAQTRGNGLGQDRVTIEVAP